LVSITLLNNTVDFGNIDFRQWNDTADNSPRPLSVENNGNSFVNITLVSTKLWNIQSTGSIYYQFKIDNSSYFSSENNSFNPDLSQMIYANIPISPKAALLAIGRLNYTNATDIADVEINVTVPTDEGSSNRNATITFTASLGE